MQWVKSNFLLPSRIFKFLLYFLINTLYLRRLFQLLEMLMLVSIRNFCCQFLYAIPTYSEMRGGFQLFFAKYTCFAVSARIVFLIPGNTPYRFKRFNAFSFRILDPYWKVFVNTGMETSFFGSRQAYYPSQSLSPFGPFGASDSLVAVLWTPDELSFSQSSLASYEGRIRSPGLRPRGS